MELIDTHINEEECFLRAVVDPQHFQKGRLHTRLFLPPKGKTDVSIYRMRYTDATRCKSVAKKLGNEKSNYSGFSFFSFKQLLTINQANPDINTTVLGTPIDENDNYITTRETYSNELGIPFHADLIYSFARPLEDDEPNTPHRKYAKSILEVAIYYEDLYLDVDEWVGPPIEALT